MTARLWLPSRRAQSRPAVAPVSHTTAIRAEERVSESQDLISWRPDPSLIGQWTLAGWLLGTVALGLVQMSRVIRFQALLREAVPAPDWVADEAQRMGDRLGVRVPEILAVPCLGTPMLWCLGRPKLLFLADSSSRSRPRAGEGSWPTSWPISAVATTGSAGSSWSRV